MQVLDKKETISHTFQKILLEDSIQTRFNIYRNDGAHARVNNCHKFKNGSHFPL